MKATIFIIITWVYNLQQYETMSCAEMFVYVQIVVLEETLKNSSKVGTIGRFEVDIA